MPNVIGIFDNSSQHRQPRPIIVPGIDRDQISLVTRDADHDKTRDDTTETPVARPRPGVGAGLGGAGD